MLGDKPATTQAAIEGVAQREIKTFPDERGFFREMARLDNEFYGEGLTRLGHTTILAETVKAWFVQPEQASWWYVPAGKLKVALYDARDGSTTYGNLMEFALGDGQPGLVIRIPAGVAGGGKALEGTAQLIIGCENSQGERFISQQELGLDYEF